MGDRASEYIMIARVGNQTGEAVRNSMREKRGNKIALSYTEEKY